MTETEKVGPDVPPPGMRMGNRGARNIRRWCDRDHPQTPAEWIMINTQAYKKKREELEAKLRELFQDSTLRWNDGSFYTGESIDGKREGNGSFTDVSGNIFSGQWKDDKKNGWFTVKYRDGEIFEGNFVNDRRSGEGTTTFADGSKYRGEYQNDVRHGKGLFWTQHEYYTLQKLWYRNYDDGVLQEESEVYTGQQRLADRPGWGFGTYIDEDGVRYEGEHEEGMRHGKGIVTERDGEQFIGEFWKDKAHGIGMKKTLDGKYYYQTWNLGELVEESETDFLNYENYFWYDEGGFASHN